MNIGTKYQVQDIKAHKKRTREFGNIRKVRKLRSGIVNAISVCIFFVTLILFSIVTLVIATTITTGSEVTSFFGFSMKIVTTGSMADTILPGDVVIIHHEADNNYKVGDIITFLSEDEEIDTYTHRIVAVVNGKNAFKTKGDANSSPDKEYAYYEGIIGKVVYIIPQFGRFIQLLQKIPFWVNITVLVIVTVVSLTIQVVDIIKCKKADLTEEERIAEENELEAITHKKFIKRLNKLLKNTLLSNLG